MAGIISVVGGSKMWFCSPSFTKAAQEKIYGELSRSYPHILIFLSSSKTSCNKNIESPRLFWTMTGLVWPCYSQSEVWESTKVSSIILWKQLSGLFLLLPTFCTYFNCWVIILCFLWQMIQFCTETATELLRHSQFIRVEALKADNSV